MSMTTLPGPGRPARPASGASYLLGTLYERVIAKEAVGPTCSPTRPSDRWSTPDSRPRTHVGIDIRREQCKSECSILSATLINRKTVEGWSEMPRGAARAVDPAQNAEQDSPSFTKGAAFNLPRRASRAEDAAEAVEARINSQLLPPGTLLGTRRELGEMLA